MDYLLAFELSKRISAETQVIVAPILMIGYSEYHNGFPGTISISPETAEKVLFECVESLIKHGFKKFLFLNEHGGNNLFQGNLINRIAQKTSANGLAVGEGSTLTPPVGIDSCDWHAGKHETSIALCLFPDLVHLDKTEKPIIKFTDETQNLITLSQKYPDLAQIWEWSMTFVPSETGKGGAVHEMSSNGSFTFNDPKEATKEYGQPFVDEMVKKVASIIEAWKLAKYYFANQFFSNKKSKIKF
jgi:creatinine amidohydrolase